MPACAVLWPDLPEHGPGYGSVVEGEDVGTDDLVCLVALAGDDDHVAGSGPGEGAADCGLPVGDCLMPVHGQDRKSTRLNSSHVSISYAVFCLKKKRILTGSEVV